MMIEIFKTQGTPMTRISCDEDPRGYVVLLGNDLDKEYQWGPQKLIISGVVEFETHVSFTLNRNYNVIVSAAENSLDCMVISIETDGVCSESSFLNTEELYSFLASNFLKERS